MSGQGVSVKTRLDQTSNPESTEGTSNQTNNTESTEGTSNAKGRGWKGERDGHVHSEGHSL